MRVRKSTIYRVLPLGVHKIEISCKLIASVLSCALEEITEGGLVLGLMRRIRDAVSIEVVAYRIQLFEAVDRKKLLVFGLVKGRERLD